MRTVHAVAVAALFACCGLPARAQEVASADAFVDSVGINVHLHYDHTPYKEQFSLVKARLLELGVRHVRDGLIDTEWQGYYDRHNELGAVGIKGTFITAFDQSLALLAAYPSRVPHSFEAYEAPNEPDAGKDADWLPRLRQMLARLGDLNRMPAVSHFPVLGPSLMHVASYPLVGNISSAFDAANLHNYLAGRHPGTPGWGDDGYGSIEWNLRQIRPWAGGKPIVTTEIGYQDGPGLADSIPIDVSGRYMPRLLIEQFRAGITRTFIYELCDFPSSGNYGLLHADGAPKPAFHAVKGLLTLLADPGPAFEPQPLAYSISSGANPVRHHAFQKRDGTYLIAVWAEEPSFDMKLRRGAPVASQPVTLLLPRPMRVLRAHRWQPDGTVASTSQGVVISAVPFEVSDRLTIIEVGEADAGLGRPGAPGPLVPVVSGRDVHLSWHAPSRGSLPEMYQIDASPDPSFSTSIVMHVPAPSTELTVPGAPPGIYFVRVRAANAAGAGEPSATVPVMVAMPGVPQLIAERVTANPVVFSWLPGPGVPPERYVISAGSMPGASDLALMPMGQASRLMAAVPLGVPFFVRVAAVGAYGAVRSNEVSFALRGPDPPPPPLLDPAAVAGSTVHLAWTAGAPASSYVVLARGAPGGAVVATLPVFGLSLTVPNVPPGAYYVSVVAQRDGMNSAESNVIRVDVSG
ncbi:MAG: fibronectin type III domain-containing protein [Acidobacteria bacterium]|nr:fibronectin type III domain-containing protein [Acidobacteriota bacterium]